MPKYQEEPRVDFTIWAEEGDSLAVCLGECIERVAVLRRKVVKGTWSWSAGVPPWGGAVHALSCTLFLAPEAE